MERKVEIIGKTKRKLSKGYRYILTECKDALIEDKEILIPSIYWTRSSRGNALMNLDEDVGVKIYGRLDSNDEYPVFVVVTKIEKRGN